MRTTINLDDELLEAARRITGVKGRTALIHEGLRALIERESARAGAAGPTAASRVDVILVDTSVWIDHLRSGNRRWLRLWRAVG